VVNGNLWIKLTVLGVTRIGVGDAEGQNNLKVMIGDALRNAGMRFGMALDLWSKEDLHDFSRAQGTVEHPAEEIPPAAREAAKTGYEHSTSVAPRKEAALVPNPEQLRLRTLHAMNTEIQKLSQADRAELSASWQEAGLPKLADLNEEEYKTARRMLDLLNEDIAKRPMALDTSLDSPTGGDYAAPPNEYYENAEGE
jgi:hypothetical protein